MRTLTVGLCCGVGNVGMCSYVSICYCVCFNIHCIAVVWLEASQCYFHQAVRVFYFGMFSLPLTEQNKKVTNVSITDV